MKEPRVEKLVEELKTTIERLNRINALLIKCDTTFLLHRSNKTSNFEITNIMQRIDYK